MNTILIGNNVEIMQVTDKFDVIYGDCIYESMDFSWLYEAYLHLNDDAVIMVQTDYHTVAEYKLALDKLGLIHVNWIIYIQEWGGTSKRFFSRKHDDILIYANSPKYKFYPDRIQIPKATAGTKLDKKGTGLKTPCDVFYDMVSFSTIARERVKGENGKNIQWQKPLKLMNRLLLPFTDEGDFVLDPFTGSGTTNLWCHRNNRNCVGIEINPKIAHIAYERLLYAQSFE